MQIFRTILGLIVTGAVVVACAVNQNDCDKNPELSCYPGHTGAGGNTMTSGGAGGGGSASCTTPAQCPSPSEKCKVVTCEAGVCGEKDQDCGALACDPISGTCGPCDDADPQKTCPQKDCYDVACVDGKCVETVNGALPCNNGQGTCDDAGSCGKCDDGVQNGDEAGVDCGPATCGQCTAEPCGVGADCKSGFCVDGVCCDAACDGMCQACDQAGTLGICSAVPVGTPDDMGANGKTCGADKGGCGATAGYCRCDDGVKNGDEADVDCGGATCERGCGTGNTCAMTSDCLSGSCADGYCCNTTCSNSCEACNLPGLEGLCSPMDAGTPDRVCLGGLVCSPYGNCETPQGESCSANGQCASNRCTSGSCVPCVQDPDCTADKVCIMGACYSRGNIGDSCPSDEGCYSGHCVDGVCCDKACTGLCMACRFNYTSLADGTCAPILAGHDPHNECPQPDPSQPGPGGSAYCSGAAAINGASSCAPPQP